MQTVSETTQLWTCPKCSRQFRRQGQAHSCKVFPLEQHFQGKPKGKLLYDHFKQAVEQRIGFFKVESLECCIHFVSTFTFAAVKIYKNKIRVDFALNRVLESNKIIKSVQMSAHRYLYYVDIETENSIDEDVLNLIQEAHDKK